MKNYKQTAWCVLYLIIITFCIGYGAWTETKRAKADPCKGAQIEMKNSMEELKSILGI